jgi:hypothetical protein
MTDLEKLNHIPDDHRQQAKLDLLVSIMEGETANFAAGVYVTLLKAFALAVMSSTGGDPFATIAQLSHHTRMEIRKELNDQGITTKAPKGH